MHAPRQPAAQRHALLLAVGAIAACHGGRPDSPRPAAPVAPATFELHDSETLDAATFLNAISDNPRFNAVGDRVLAVNDVRLAGRDLETILDLLAGPPGAALRLEIQRGGERRLVPLRLGE
jgi:S1-C subfamily serine protease